MSSMEQEAAMRDPCSGAFTVIRGQKKVSRNLHLVASRADARLRLIDRQEKHCRFCAGFLLDPVPPIQNVRKEEPGKASAFGPGRSKRRQVRRTVRARTLA